MGIKRKAQRSRGPSDVKKRAATNIGTAVAMHQAAVTLKRTFDKEIRGTTEEERARVGGPFLAESILAAFGIENALKALIRREGKEPNNLHNLKKLYGMLDSETKKRICEKGASIPTGRKSRGIRIEGVIDAHQNSFQELRYRESGKDLPVIPGLLTNTLRAIIETHQEKYGEEVEREERQGTGQVSPATMPEMLQKYYESVLILKSG